MEINYKDISEKKEFTYDGTILLQVEYCESSGRYLYKRSYPDGRILGWEVVKPIKRVNPSGETVFIYPATNSFGLYGWFLPPKAERTKIDYYLQGFNKQMEYKEYLKTLKK